jgi:hypothetical protein
MKVSWAYYSQYMGKMFQTTNQNYLLKMAIEIVDLPMNSMVIFHSKPLVYQRVTHISSAKSPLLEWLNGYKQR